MQYLINLEVQSHAVMCWKVRTNDRESLKSEKFFSVCLHNLSYVWTQQGIIVTYLLRVWGSWGSKIKKLGTLNQYFCNDLLKNNITVLRKASSLQVMPLGLCHYWSALREENPGSMWKRFTGSEEKSYVTKGGFSSKREEVCEWKHDRQ